jgi:signal peptidase I
MLDLFLPSHVKRGKRVLEAVQKFISYNRDVMTPANLDFIETAKKDYKAVLETRDKEKLAAEEESLTRACDKALPGYRADAIKENVEVIIVAIVIALSVRAYIAQPFKIPTASMQPTLNGINGAPMGKDVATPNIAQQAWEYVWRGSNYTELRSPAGAETAYIVNVTQKSTAMFFTRTTVTFGDGSSQTCYCPAIQLLNHLWLDNELPSTQPLAGRGLRISQSDDFTRSFNPGIPVPGGKVLAKGRVDTGDQLIVDKFSYHFRPPARGEVFVFTTMAVQVKQDQPTPMPNNGVPSQHYIKRLVGVPNDTLTVIPPQLYVNGEVAKEPGIGKVMAHEGNPDCNQEINMLHGYKLPGYGPNTRQVAQDTAATPPLQPEGPPILCHGG